MPVFLSFVPLSIGCVWVPPMQPPANAGAVERENAASPSKTQKFPFYLFVLFFTDGAARQITQIDSLIFMHLLDNELTTAGFIVLVVRIDGNAVTDGSRGR